MKATHQKTSFNLHIVFIKNKITLHYGPKKEKKRKNKPNKQ